MNLETIVTWLLPRPRPGNVLSDDERRTLAAAADVLLEDVDFAVAHEDVARNVERFIRASRRAWRVRALLVFVELAPLVASGRRFSRASRAERARMLREGSPARARSLFRRVRPLVVLGAYANANARRRVGWVEVRDRPRFRRNVVRLQVAS